MGEEKRSANDWIEVPGKGAVRNFRSVALRLLVSVREDARGERVEIMTLTAGKPSDERTEAARMALGVASWSEIPVVDPVRRVFRVGAGAGSRAAQSGPSTGRDDPGEARGEYLGQDEVGEFVAIDSRFESQCIGCGKRHRIGERVVWSPTNGGACCEACWSKHRSECWRESLDSAPTGGPKIVK